MSSRVLPARCLIAMQKDKVLSKGSPAARAAIMSKSKRAFIAYAAVLLSAVLGFIIFGTLQLSGLTKMADIEIMDLLRFIRESKSLPAEVYTMR